MPGRGVVRIGPLIARVSSRIGVALSVVGRASGEVRRIRDDLVAEESGSGVHVRVLVGQRWTGLVAVVASSLAGVRSALVGSVLSGVALVLCVVLLGLLDASEYGVVAVRPVAQVDAQGGATDAASWFAGARHALVDFH